MKIIKYVHATFEIEINNTKILIDPGKYNFGSSRYDRNYMSPNEFNPDILILTHTHADHYDPEAVRAIYNKNKPVIIANKEVGDQLGDIEHIVMNPNDKFEVNNIEFIATECKHIVPAIGMYIKSNEKSIYYVGDSLMIDSHLNPDILIVPIGNRDLVMSPNDAAIFTKRLNPEYVIPMHYESPKDKATPEDFRDEMSKLNSKANIIDLHYKQSIVF